MLGTLLLVACHMGLAWRLRHPGITTGNDDALYVLLSRSLRHLSYADAHILGSPPHVQYPPGYPALLALAGSAFGDSPDHFMLLGVLCSGLALLLWYDIASRLWSPWLGLAVVASAASNPWLIQYAGFVASEAPYLLVSTVSVWLLVREDSSRMSGYLAGLAAILAALFRSIGVTLVAAVGLHWLTTRRFRRVAAFAGGVLITLGVWFAWTALAGPQVPGRSYVGDVASSLAEPGGAAGRIQFYAGRVAAVLTRRVPSALAVPTIEGTGVDNALWLFVTVLFGGTGAWFVWRRSPCIPLYATTMLLLMVIWPYSLTRFLIPLVPVLVLLVLVGIMAAGRSFPPVVTTSLAAALTMLLAGAGWARTADLAERMAECERASAVTSPGCYNEDQRSFFAAARFAADSTPADAVFLTAKEAAFAYYASRRVVYPGAFSRDPAGLLAALQRLGVRYIVLGKNAEIEPGFLASALERFCDRLELVASFPPRTYLFKVSGDSVPRSPGGACQAVYAYRADPSPILPAR
jgi:hypothetical protein